MKYFCFVLLFISVNILSAQDNYEKSLRYGLKLACNFQFKESEDVYKSLIQKEPDDPRAYTMLLKNFVWKYLSSDDDNSLKEFEKYSELALEKSKNLIKNNEFDYTGNYCYLNIQGNRTFIYLMKKDYLKGIWSAKETFRMTNFFEKNFPNDFDSYFWKGLFNFALSQIPGSFKSILSIAGIEGNYLRGLKELEIAAQKSDFNKTESIYMLSQILSLYVDESETSLRLLQALNSEFPENYLISYSLASEKIKTLKLDDAEKLLNKIYKTLSGKNKIFFFTRFLLGDINFFRGQFNKSVKYYSEFLQFIKGNDYFPVAAFRLAISYKMLNKNEEYLNCITSANEIKGAGEEAEYYYDKIKNLNERNITNNELQIILIENKTKSGDFDSAKTIIREYLKKYSDTESIRQAKFLEGIIYFRMKNYEDAVKILQRVSSQYEISNWISAFSLYYIGLCYKAMYEKQKALENLKKILTTYINYFDNSIKLKAKYQVDNLETN